MGGTSRHRRRFLTTSVGRSPIPPRIRSATFARKRGNSHKSYIVPRTSYIGKRIENAFANSFFPCYHGRV